MLQNQENFSETLQMFFPSFAVDKNIVDDDQNKLPSGKQEDPGAVRGARRGGDGSVLEWMVVPLIRSPNHLSKPNATLTGVEQVRGEDPGQRGEREAAVPFAGEVRRRRRRRASCRGLQQFPEHKLVVTWKVQKQIMLSTSSC